MSEINVTIGKRGASGRGAPHIARPGVNGKGELRGWCGSPMGGEIRENVTELPDDVHTKCVEKMRAAMGEGDTAPVAGKPASPDYSRTSPVKHVKAVHIRWERARLARIRAEREAAKKDAEPTDTAPVATGATTPEPDAKPKPKNARSKNTGPGATRSGGKRPKASVKSGKPATRPKSVALDALAEALVNYRLDPDTDVLFKVSGGVVHVIPQSEKAFKRIRDRGRKINNRLSRAGVRCAVLMDEKARTFKLVPDSKEGK